MKIEIDPKTKRNLLKLKETLPETKSNKLRDHLIQGLKLCNKEQQSEFKKEFGKIVRLKTKKLHEAMDIIGSYIMQNKKTFKQKV